MKLKNLGILLLLIIITFAAGLIGGFFTFPSIPTWYADLQKPSWNPPNFIFGPVWNTLYLMMSVASWLVWLKVKFQFKPFFFYFSQLFLNMIWSILFFGIHRPDLAFMEITLLWIMIGMTIFSFLKIRPIAGVLLIPYWIWVSFAGFLNFTIWQMN